MGAPEEPPAVSIHALRPSTDPDILLVTVQGVFDRAGATRFGDEVGDLLRFTGASIVICDLGGVTHANAAAVDAVCRVHLAARRLGCRLRLRHASPELAELLDLMGLCDVVDDASGRGAPRPDGSGVDPQG